MEAHLDAIARQVQPGAGQRLAEAPRTARDQPSDDLPSREGEPKKRRHPVAASSAAGPISETLRYPGKAWPPRGQAPHLGTAGRRGCSQEDWALGDGPGGRRERPTLHRNPRRTRYGSNPDRQAAAPQSGRSQSSRRRAELSGSAGSVCTAEPSYNDAHVSCCSSNLNSRLRGCINVRTEPETRSVAMARVPGRQKWGDVAVVAVALRGSC